jgi:flagellar basal-body rod protein FlgB
MQVPSLFDATTGQLSYALNGLSRRQDLIATNIANSDTPGYLTHEINFEQSLMQAMSDSSGNGSGGEVPDQLPADYTRNDLRVKNDGNNVDSNLQMTEMAQTVVTYQTSAQLLSGKFNLLKAAIAPVS